MRSFRAVQAVVIGWLLFSYLFFAFLRLLPEPLSS